ncbi:condensation domain-containing protein [Bacillus paralicheniformis]|uniref:condensation domain-containing protein n=3 Tax=Bacillus paralicheniformis TaxID=1648923 RepID=UPI002DB59C3C|nr:condensation domain-containing protein [Bacillus paralicheniformis]MEC1020419.1 condensation domain-containing protein [Bacillus paralicheniformis]MEC1026426.1 condensation domain-containing protein [Bacillus paralicheniformis]MEC1036656.1 condensation domain-containing protein [Bacillus paralicheniformis]MEC1052897.1 condensation domain-containing protein [Bacillus paralicheniformis]MEC1060180.1 condensation domain-containing protein [Bacillus paralicheniformis]
MLEHDSIIDILQYRAKEAPNTSAFTFLRDGEAHENTWTYKDLYINALGIGAGLQSIAPLQSRVLLIFSPGLEVIGAFYGTMLAGMTSVPCTPPDDGRFVAKLERIIRDIDPAVILTDEKLMKNKSLLELSKKTNIPIITTSVLLKQQTSQESPPPMNELALIQYTSGSTGFPKGIMISHSNIIHNQKAIAKVFAKSEQATIVSWLPYFHDMGLIGNIIYPIFSGVHCIFMSPAHFIRKPIRWLQAISRYSGTISGGPNFAYEWCLSRITESERKELDLSNWKMAYSGAEMIKADTLEKFYQMFRLNGFSKSSFRPCYGLAETTLFVSGHQTGDTLAKIDVDAKLLQKNEISLRTSDSVRKIVSCGQPLIGRIAIVDEDGCELGEKKIGEIWVSGESVALGYWNKPHETVQSFRANLSSSEEEFFLRTGDLGFIHDGCLYITGRLKDLIIIRGRNIYPSDIEDSVQSVDPALRKTFGAAFSLEAEEEDMIIVQEIPKSLLKSADHLIEKIRNRIVQDYNIEPGSILLVRDGSLPKTSSLKIQRKAVKLAYLNNALDVRCAYSKRKGFEVTENSGELKRVLSQEHSHEKQQQIQRLMVQILCCSLNLPPHTISATSTLREIGLDSLQAASFLCDLEQKAGLTSSVFKLNGGFTIKELAEKMSLHAGRDIQKKNKKAAPHITGMSYGQKAIWFLQQLNPESTAYNIVRIFEIKQSIDTGALNRALIKIGGRHQLLRMKIVRDPMTEEVCFKDRHKENIAFVQVDAAELSKKQLLEKLKKEARTPFHLLDDPLLKIILFKKSEEGYILFFSVHHIIADFWSLASFLNELKVYYEAELLGVELRLPKPKKKFSEFVEDQKDMVSDSRGEKLLKYWTEKLKKPPPNISLPSVIDKKKKQTTKGGILSFDINKKVLRDLEQLAQDNNTTLFVILLAVFNILLYKYTSEQDIMVASNSHGRYRGEYSDTFGYFVNLFIIRSKIQGDETFETYLKRLDLDVQTDLAHSELPFSLLVEQLRPERKANDTPFTNVFFTYQSAPRLNREQNNLLGMENTASNVEIGPFHGRAVPLNDEETRFDLDVAVTKANDSLVGYVKYNSFLYDEYLISQFVEHYQNLIRGVTKNSGIEISSMFLMSREEEHKYLRKSGHSLLKWNPEHATLHECFEHVSATSPEHTAVVDREESFTYKELSVFSSKLANLIKEAQNNE